MNDLEAELFKLEDDEQVIADEEKTEETVVEEYHIEEQIEETKEEIKELEETKVEEDATPNEEETELVEDEVGDQGGNH